MSLITTLTEQAQSDMIARGGAYGSAIAVRTFGTVQCHAQSARVLNSLRTVTRFTWKLNGKTISRATLAALTA